jgi:putative transposase
MPKKRFKAEQIAVLPCQIEVLMSQGKAASVACPGHFAAELLSSA